VVRRSQYAPGIWNGVPIAPFVSAGVDHDFRFSNLMTGDMIEMVSPRWPFARKQRPDFSIFDALS
jgi:hypothetical protein